MQQPTIIGGELVSIVTSKNRLPKFSCEISISSPEPRQLFTRRSIAPFFAIYTRAPSIIRWKLSGEYKARSTIAHNSRVISRDIGAYADIKTFFVILVGVRIPPIPLLVGQLVLPVPEKKGEGGSKEKRVAIRQIHSGKRHFNITAWKFARCSCRRDEGWGMEDDWIDRGYLR